jgi:hypothetical protein
LTPTLTQLPALVSQYLTLFRVTVRQLDAAPLQVGPRMKLRVKSIQRVGDGTDASGPGPAGKNALPKAAETPARIARAARISFIVSDL